MARYDSELIRRITRLQPVIAALPILALVAPAAAQSVHFSAGAIGGVRFSSGAPSALHDESPRYAVGPALELSVGDHLAVEVEGLYRRFGYSHAAPLALEDGGTMYLFLRGRTNSAEFPILGKYYFGERTSASRFFVGTGYSFQRSWQGPVTQPTVGLLSSTLSSRSLPPYLVVSPVPYVASGPGTPISQSAATGVGAAFEAGWSRKAGPLAITPTFRYTHWGSRADSGSHNQTEFLLGLWF